jgi:hypothetical protein
MSFAHLHASGARAIEQDLIERGPRHVISPRRRHFRDRGEVDAPPALAVMGDQPRSELLRKPGRGHLLRDAEEREGVVGGREQRLADVKAREGLTLEQHDGTSALRQGNCRGRSGRAAACYCKVVVVRHERRAV